MNFKYGEKKIFQYLPYIFFGIHNFIYFLGVGPYEHLVDVKQIGKEIHYDPKTVCFRNSIGEQIYGVMKCQIGISRQNALALKNIPILPCKVLDKKGGVFYSFCRTCTEIGNINSCHHTLDDRSFSDSWVKK